MYQTDTHCSFRTYILLRRRLVINVIPLQETGVMLGFFIIREIVAHHFTYMEVVAQLKSKYRVINFFLSYFVDIFFRTYLVGILVVIGNASAEHDGFQVQRFADFLAVFVHTACQTQSAILRMDKDFDTIENITFRVMSIKSFLTRNLSIGMVILYIIIIYDNGECTSHYLFIHYRYNLSFRKDTNQFFYLFVCPEYITSI